MLRRLCLWANVYMCNTSPAIREDQPQRWVAQVLTNHGRAKHRPRSARISRRDMLSRLHMWANAHMRDTSPAIREDQPQRCAFKVTYVDKCTHARHIARDPRGSAAAMCSGDASYMTDVKPIARDPRGSAAAMCFQDYLREPIHNAKLPLINPPSDFVP